ncbi:MerR family transcriptional regulator [uncultured Limosilactobacillus sp.]|uniref:MerR family transcriptional regulator n=1 Tax=uncultured Limosilactobacillus sp. TaxID=2837629 RepID=UPI0025E42C67|nr:MerR family transcriptional regulator [uncultured Limosilactobacillus sp.]
MPTMTKKQTFTIGQVAKQFGLSIPTIRYYDAEGLIPGLSRTANGKRLFTRDNLETINMIGCLKKTGMSIKEIKQFVEWCCQGDETLPQRQAMFHQLQQSLLDELATLKTTLEVVDFKCHYYDIAVEHHSEEVAKTALANQQPAGLKINIDA